jgi:SnoaL-like domain
VTSPAPDELGASHVAAFNQAVESADFDAFLATFADDATIRFENLPAGELEFAGRPAYTAAYEQRPPDDQIDIAGPIGWVAVEPFAGDAAADAAGDATEVIIPFAWRRDRASGTIRLLVASGLIQRMVVRFD